MRREIGGIKGQSEKALKNCGHPPQNRAVAIAPAAVPGSSKARCRSGRRIRGRVGFAYVDGKLWGPSEMVEVQGGEHESGAHRDAVKQW